MIINVKELSGLSSYSAFQVFYKVLLGLKMYVAYAHYKPDEFFDHIGNLSIEDQEKIVREALMLVPIEKDEILILASFCTDKNGVPFGIQNMGSLNPKQVLEILVKSCMELVKIKIDFVNEDEKKNSETSPLM